MKIAVCSVKSMFLSHVTDQTIYSQCLFVSIVLIFLRNRYFSCRIWIFIFINLWWCRIWICIFINLWWLEIKTEKINSFKFRKKKINHCYIHISLFGLYVSFLFFVCLVFVDVHHHVFDEKLNQEVSQKQKSMPPKKIGI